MPSCRMGLKPLPLRLGVGAHRSLVALGDADVASMRRPGEAGAPTPFSQSGSGAPSFAQQAREEDALSGLRATALPIPGRHPRAGGDGAMRSSGTGDAAD